MTIKLKRTSHTLAGVAPDRTGTVPFKPD